MINYKYFDLFWEDSLPKEVKIESGSIVLTNDDLYNQEMELEESLCSDEGLRFGCCEASVFKFKTSEMFVSMSGKSLNVSLMLNGNPDSNFPLGIYKVDSDKLDASKRYREVVAYDAMYDIINTDMTTWYNSVLPNKNSKMYLWQFREKIVRYFGLTEVVPAGGLVNDNMIVERTIDPEQISGKDIITAICEINGCFGHIGRDNKFHYIYLPQAIEGLYPANDLYPDHAPEYMAQAKTGHLYPQDPKGITVGKNKNYIECTYEDFVTAGITHVQIRGSENDAGYTYPSDPVTEKDNLYIIEDNFLTYGKSDAELMQIEINLLSKIANITYRPYNLKVRANPCIEVGDAIRTNTDRQLIESYVLRRTMTGIQAFTDNLSAAGTEKFEQNVNSVQKSIIQLKGKTNELTRTQEETRSELKDLEAGTESKFVQTAAEIQAEVTRAQGAEGQLSSRINLTAEEISAEVTRAKGAEGQLSASLSVTAEEIRTEVTRAKGAESSLSSSISQTATQIRTEVANADAALSSSITQNANQIALKVSKGDVSSQISLENGQVTISGNRLVVDSTNFKLDKNGNVSVKGAVNATSFSFDNGTTSMSADDTGLKLNSGASWREVGFISTAGSSYGSGAYGALYASSLDFGSSSGNTGELYFNGSYFNFSVPLSVEWSTVVTSGNIYSMIPSSFIDDFDKIEESGKASNFYSGFSHQGRKLIGTKRPIDTSDERLKKDVKPLPDMQGVYMQLTPISFKFADDLKGYDKQVQYGFSAQKVQGAFESHGFLENAVVWESKPDNDLNEDKFIGFDDVIYKLDKEQMHAMHVQMIQKQQKELNGLKMSLLTMQGDLAILRNQMEELKNDKQLQSVN